MKSNAVSNQGNQNSRQNLPNEGAKAVDEGASKAMETVQRLGDSVTTKVQEQYDHIHDYISHTDVSSAFEDLKSLAKKHP